MWSWFAILTLIFLIQPGPAANTVKAADGHILISSPVTGEVVQGIVSITGSIDLKGFIASEVDFTYHGKGDSGWFLIQQNDQAVQDGTIAAWDTTTITDGTYDLLLVVKLADGSQKTFQVNNIRVRNYSLIETETPSPTITQTQIEAVTQLPTTVPSLKPDATETMIPPTLTPFPANSASLNNTEIISTLGKGGLVAAGLFLVGGLYLGFKSYRKR